MVGSLPGLAAGYLVAGVIGTTIRPKRRRDWDYGCYSQGGSCWVHVHFPYSSSTAVGPLPDLRHPSVSNQLSDPMQDVVSGMGGVHRGGVAWAWRWKPAPSAAPRGRCRLVVDVLIVVTPWYR
ncbi:hypothetical protein GCM10010383_22700 [Streptomyces lomondensis]|uniref:Uncharacterized protein n=1 Tax=Streptomyces lomondensis TaxID=68229 RepID=A0ABQ2X1P2_9ACTN|nr:hypothetical protein GCM10010383_22700 [Streptomyces lomondensis]